MLDNPRSTCSTKTLQVMQWRPQPAQLTEIVRATNARQSPPFAKTLDVWPSVWMVSAVVLICTHVLLTACCREVESPDTVLGVFALRT